MDPDTPARQRLLARVADHILEHGVADLSLSGLARGAGSNNRMLLYYFGSKEQLVSEASMAAVARFPHLDGVLDRLRDGDGALDERLRRVWDDIAHAGNRPFLALFFQAFAVALYHPERNTAFLRLMGGDWVSRVGEVLEAEGHGREDALRIGTQLVAEWRGLQFALLAGAPRAVLDRAHDELVAAIPVRR